MKANSIFRVIMVVALLMSTMFTMSLKATNSSNGVLNNEYDSNNNVTSTVIYRNTHNLLTPLYRYEYKYNSDNQIIEKVTLKWDGEQWNKCYIVNVSYNGGLANLNYSTWNAESNKYMNYSTLDCDTNNVIDNIK